MIRIYLKKSAAAALAAAIFLGASASASDMNGTKAISCEVGDNLTLGTYSESAARTQRLIDNRPNIRRRIGDMGRGLVAVKSDNGVFVSWRWKGTESINVKYNLYKNGKKVNSAPMGITCYTDIDGTLDDRYAVSAVVDGAETEKCAETAVWDGYYEIPLVDPPEAAPVEGSTGLREYTPGDAAAGDLDGDGEYELVLKWNGKTRDAAGAGYTSICYLDGYELDGTRLWRVSMGPNIRSGEHDTQFMVADFDGDGKAEMACRTADGTVDGKGKVIGDASADWYTHNNGKNLDGPLYLTVFNGADGAEKDTVDFYPQSEGTWQDGTKWGIDSWGDDSGNRSERYLGAVASFDGVNTSFIQARGYYDRTCIGAWHLEDGKIKEDWTFDSHDYPNAEPKVSGQGYHNMVTADVDYDGRDEVIFGNLVLDDNGEPLYSTGLGHGDAIHAGDLIPSRPGLEVYTVQESTKAEYGFVMRDARTGELLYGMNTATDVGRAATADIDPRYEGEEAWSAYGVLTASDGTVLSTSYSIPANYAIYWDGDLGREIEDGNGVYKYDIDEQRVKPIFKAAGAHSINAAKSNPCLQADIFGDWREELIFPSDDNRSLRIYTTTEPTAYRIPSLMSDGEYMNAVTWQNNCYNQPPHLDYYLGYDTETVPVPRVFSVAADGSGVTNPDLEEREEYGIDELYFGEEIDLVINNPTALVNGAKRLIDNDDPNIKPYLDEADRTMVPLRFVAEAFGAAVGYDEETTEITIISRDINGDRLIRMKPGDSGYHTELNGAAEAAEMDTVPVLENGRTMVPVRFIAEALGRYVDYDDGLVRISTLKDAAEDAATLKSKLNSTDRAVRGTDYAELENYGDKSLGLRHEITEITTSDGTDGSAVTDYDAATSWVCPAGGEIVFRKADSGGTPAAVVMFGDDERHRFNIEYSSDGENWQLAAGGRISLGKSGAYEKYYFGVPPYPAYIKYVSLDDTDTVISELAFAVVD